MQEDNNYSTAIVGALARLLRPLVRLLLRHSLPYAVLEEVAKRVYVDVAMTEFALPGRKPSISRSSILTGLTRKEVARLAEQPVSDGASSALQYNRATRVLSAWARDPALHGADGRPRALPVDGSPGFAALVREHSGDMPVRAVLDELERVGAVRTSSDGSVVELVQRAFVPSQGTVQKIGILGRDVAELIETIDHNIEHGATDPRYQRKVMHVGIPIDVLAEFREQSAAQAQALLERLDAWLTVRDMKHRSAEGGDTRVPTTCVGVGIYYYEQRSGSSNAAGSNP